MNHTFKYQNDLDTLCLTCSCPDEEYFIFPDKECYRFVFENIAHPNNFIPVAKINPVRLLNAECKSKCKLFGLSLFGTKDGALKRYEELTVTSSKNFKKRIGTHIAKGTIPSNCGQITSEERHTHFELYEYQNSTINTVFKIIQQL